MYRQLVGIVLILALMNEISGRKTKLKTVSTAYAMEHQKDFKEQIQEALALVKDRLANNPTRDDLKDCLRKVEEDIIKRLIEKLECQEAKIKQLEEHVDSLPLNDAHCF